MEEVIEKELTEIVNKEMEKVLPKDDKTEFEKYIIDYEEQEVDVGEEGIEFEW